MGVVVVDAGGGGQEGGAKLEEEEEEEEEEEGGDSDEDPAAGTGQGAPRTRTSEIVKMRTHGVAVWRPCVAVVVVVVCWTELADRSKST